jgi:MoxR-like ATPase
VVLVDEIDKAPSDFPNDALNEIERHYVRVRELGEERVLQADAAMRPIIVITSNSEKQLPDAFLRRCVFHHVRPMSAEKLKAVALKRLGAWAQGLTAGPLLDDAVALYFELRDEPLPGARRASVRFELRKKPATAEFLAFVGALVQSGASMQQGLTPELARPWLSTLVKSAEDWEAAAQHRLLRKPA